MAYTVADLRDALEEYPDDLEVRFISPVSDDEEEQTVIDSVDLADDGTYVILK